MASRVEVPVFTDTNLGTHIAIGVSPDITARDFKRELERAHLNCFPKLGEITVNGIMVKRKSCLYHLPNSLPLKHAFQGLKGTWFIHMEACFRNGSDKSGFSECLAAEIRDRTSNSSDVTDSLEPKNCASSANKSKANCKRKKRGIKRFPCLKLKAVLQVIQGTVHLSKRKTRKRVKKNHFLHRTVKGLEKGHLGRNDGGTANERELFASRTEGEHGEDWKSSAMCENPSETLSEALSVSGIIKKYFSDYEEVTLSSDLTSRANQRQRKEQLMTGADYNCSKAEARAMPQFTAKTPPRMLLFPLPTGLNSETSRDKFKRIEVGKRLLVASNKLGSSSLQKSATGLCRFGVRKLSVPKSSSLVRSIVFEISDNDE